jgi:hypothetical protein
MTSVSYLIYRNSWSKTQRSVLIASSHMIAKSAKIAAAAASTAGKAVKGAAKIGLKAIPIVGGLTGAASNVEAKGLIVGGLETIVDCIPYVGAAKASYELSSGKNLFPTEQQRAEAEIKQMEIDTAKEWARDPMRYGATRGFVAPVALPFGGGLPGVNFELWDAQEMNLRKHINELD